MHLEKLQLENFKNYRDQVVEFPARINFLLGLNGSGKTNLLDAIYYLSATKSFSHASDTSNIYHGEDHFSITGSFQQSGRKHTVYCQVGHGKKKVFREDSREYDKLSDHIGKYPVVLISPMDVDLVKESSEARRKFFDQMIAQVDHHYLEMLVEYHHALKQRNALLKMFAERNSIDDVALSIYNQQLVRTGTTIYKKRKDFVAEFVPIFNRCYKLLVQEQEDLSLGYSSDLETGDDFEQELSRALKRDMDLQRTTVGIHRDDYIFGFAHGELKRLGSQGQQKSFLVSIKLAQVDVIRMHAGFLPILLLDDIFDKLDDVRIASLMNIVAGDGYGQLFITDAGPERTISLKERLGIQGDIFRVEKGHIFQ